MMTCARVREYNSNPPLQVHLLPARRPEEAMTGVSQMLASPGGPEPTKVLEIISGCNWESHRSLVLKELFRSIHANRLAALHAIDVYRVELLSEELKADETGSTLTYRVCVSLPEKPLEPRGTARAGCVRTSSQRLKCADVGETPAKCFPLLARLVPAGFLKAERKTALRSGHIKVNGKAYAQAKLLLGRVGALHPANRLAAYLTGRIKPVPVNTRPQSKPVQLHEARRARSRGSSKHTVSPGAFRAPATQTLAIYQAPDGIKRTPTLYIFSHVHNPAAPPSSTHVTSSQPGLILTAVAPPLSCVTAVAPPLSSAPVVAPPLSCVTAVALPLSDQNAIAPPLSGKNAIAPPLSDQNAIAPPLSDQNAVAPPLSSAPAVAPPLTDQNAIAPPLSDQNAVAPPLSDQNAIAPPLSGQNAVAPPLSSAPAVAPPLSGLPTVAQPISVAPPPAVAPPLFQAETVLPPPAVAPPLCQTETVLPPPTVAPPLCQTETVLPASALAPGQQVVLQPVAGMMGVNMCQFNGQTIQLVPVPPALPVTSAGSAQQEALTSTQRPQSTRSVLIPAPAPKPFPFIAPRIHSASGSTSFTFGSAAHNGFLAKNNMFSFRIFPPASSGLQHTEAGGAGSSVLLPGGYRLIKLPTMAQPAVNPEIIPETPREDTRQSSVPIKAEPSDPPLCIKVEPYSESLPTDERQDAGGAEGEPVRIKIEPYEETSDIIQNHDPALKAEQPDRETNITCSESAGPVSAGHPRTNVSSDFSCSLFMSPISQSLNLSKRTFAVPLLPPQTHTPEEPRTHTRACATPAGGHRGEEGQNRIQWLWKRRPALSDGSGSEVAAEDSSAALMHCSDGWTTEDSNEKSSDDEVDIEAFEESDERIICRLRAKARRKTPQRAAPHQWLARLVGKASQHAVRLMSDLPLYKRTFRLNQALRERKRQVELHQSLDSLRRTLCVDEDDSMSTEDLLRQARRVVGALEDHGRSLMAQKRALIQQHSHYQTLISQRSVAGTQLHVGQKSAAPSSETPQSVGKRHSRLPNIVLQSFTSPKPVLNQS